MTLLLSLFPGVDLLGHAFELEWPETCVVRGPDLIFGSLSDIRRFHPPAGKFDGVFGGPPCQSFSSLAHLVRVVHLPGCCRPLRIRQHKHRQVDPPAARKRKGAFAGQPS